MSVMSTQHVSNYQFKSKVASTTASDRASVTIVCIYKLY